MLVKKIECSNIIKGTKNPDHIRLGLTPVTLLKVLTSVKTLFLNKVAFTGLGLPHIFCGDSSTP